MEVKKEKEIFKIPQNDNAGIYMLFNINNKKAYIGQTTNFKRRAIQHREQLLNNAHLNKKVQKDFNNGMEFCFVILEEVEAIRKKELRMLELQYIFNFHFKFMKLYNQETIEQTKDLLFWEMVRKEQDRIQRNLRKTLECPVPLLKHCSIRKLKEKFRICS